MEECRISSELLILSLSPDGLLQNDVVLQGKSLLPILETAEPEQGFDTVFASHQMHEVRKYALVNRLGFLCNLQTNIYVPSFWLQYLRRGKYFEVNVQLQARYTKIPDGLAR